ncbi:MAG: hypothetical protein SVM79_00010 [Chloroflexota bacterium]|nr:hypothetical protein [Chloroflexota bacterium]
MANIDLTYGSVGTHMPATASGSSYKMRKRIDFAEALEEKGSALASSDVIQALDIPVKHVVVAAVVHPVTAADATTLTLDVGFASSPEADADNFVDGFDATQTTTDGVPIFSVQGYTTAATTLDVTLATLTGTLTSGVVDLVAWVVDMS